MFACDTVYIWAILTHEEAPTPFAHRPRFEGFAARISIRLAMQSIEQNDRETPAAVTLSPARSPASAS